IFDKMVSNIQEILARKGKVIAVASLGNSQIKDYIKEVIFIPKIKDIFSPLLTVLPLQLLAYYMAVLKGFDVDKPRNLAKSVTVE
ncbi:MAG: glutamine--fructose-6-phosphate aminotransferase, partial [Candidatus Omnitrophota bacterium]